MFVDWAGATIPVHDRHTGHPWQSPLFVAALGASSYTWAEATRDMQMEAWLRCHVHAFEHFHGIPQLAVPDNCKTGVSKAHRYDPDLNPTYYNFAVHCGFGIVPARPYKPRDKAKVENAVQVAQRWIVAALRHRKFFSLEELNQAIRELLTRLNHRSFRKRDGTRASAWEAIDKPALKPLPTEPFDLSEWSRARVNIDYHVSFDANLYSVPYNLVHELVEIRSTPTTVEILHKGTRVASHLRSRERGKPITQDEHRPKSHREHLEWTPSRMVHWAASIGPHTARLFERIMADKPHPEMGYRDGYSALYVRAPALFRDLAIARADGSLRSVLARFGRIDVLVIDDWAMAPLAETERRDFWEICEDRYQTRSTILTSQLPVARWHEQIGDATAADGILDRLVHNAHRIEMRGDSMRKKRDRKSTRLNSSHSS